MNRKTAVVGGPLAFVLGLVLSGCAMGESPVHPRPNIPVSARDIHVANAQRAGTPGVRVWEDAGRSALRSGLRVPPSFRERLRFPDGESHAVAYRFALARGQVVHVTLRRVDGADALFADVFQHAGMEMFRPVHSTRTRGTFSVQARTDGEYVLRLQPPLGAGATYEVEVLGDQAILFPVADAGMRAIGGVFGDPRDGGARRHEGVDIFAPRGTPVLAVADGWVRQARNTPTGGLVIWQSDAARDLTYYYAHLDELLVREGTYVRAGETIGTVGNTGNARTTRPHLHFGVYRPGRVATDPAPLLAATATAPNELYAPTPVLGEWIRLNGARARLHGSPDPTAVVIAEVAPATSLLVLGDLGDWQRVVLEDGRTGFIAASFTGAAADGSP